MLGVGQVTEGGVCVMVGQVREGGSCVRGRSGKEGRVLC